jgi:hypothetical protein
MEKACVCAALTHASCLRERSSMGQQNLKNLMLWRSLAVKQVDSKYKLMDCKDLPVMEILKEFRTMAGPAGRKAHRAAPKVEYEYEKHRMS